MFTSMQSSEKCVQICDQNKPATGLALNNWCIIVSNPGSNPIYATVDIKITAPTTTSANGPVVVTPSPSAGSINEWNHDIFFFFGLVLHGLFGSLMYGKLVISY